MEDRSRPVSINGLRVLIMKIGKLDQPNVYKLVRWIGSRAEFRALFEEYEDILDFTWHCNIPGSADGVF